MKNEKDYQLLYYYEQMANDTNLTVRLPEQLKKDFIERAGNKAYTKVLRELLVNYISDKNKTQSKE